MAQLKNDYSHSELCQALEISSSGSLAHQQKDQRPRRQQDRQLVALLEPIFRQSRQTYQDGNMPSLPVNFYCRSALT